MTQRREGVALAGALQRVPVKGEGSQVGARVFLLEGGGRVLVCRTQVLVTFAGVHSPFQKAFLVLPMSFK